MLNLSVDICHWLDEHGEPAEPVRRKALWIARMIEYGGPLESGFCRETLIECTMRPKRRACRGLLWVGKAPDGRIDAWCRTCDQLNIIVTGWEGTFWANGPMEPLGPEPEPVRVSGELSN
jgi:hypothetical protein